MFKLLSRGKSAFKWLGLTKLSDNVAKKIASWSKKGAFTGWISRISSQLGLSGSSGVGAIKSFVSKGRWASWAASFGTSLMSFAFVPFAYLVSKILKNSKFVSAISRLLKKFAGKKVFRSKYGANKALVLTSESLTMHGSKFANPIFKTLSKSKTATSSKIKGISTFVRDLVIWEAAEYVFDSIFNDDEDTDDDELVSLNEFNKLRESSRAERTLKDSNAGYNPQDAARISHSLKDISEKLVLGIHSDFTPGHVLTLIDVLAAAIGECDRSAVLRSHAINKLLKNSDSASNAVLKDLLYDGEEEDAELAADLYLESLKIAVNEYQYSICEEVLDDEPSMSPVMLMPSLTLVDDAGIWNFDEAFEDEDLSVLEDLDNMSNSFFEIDRTSGQKVYEIYADFEIRHKTMSVAGSIG